MTTPSRPRRKATRRNYAVDAGEGEEGEEGTVDDGQNGQEPAPDTPLQANSAQSAPSTSQPDPEAQAEDLDAQHPALVKLLELLNKALEEKALVPFTPELMLEVNSSFAAEADTPSKSVLKKRGRPGKKRVEQSETNGAEGGADSAGQAGAESTGVEAETPKEPSTPQPAKRGRGEEKATETVGTAAGGEQASVDTSVEDQVTNTGTAKKKIGRPSTKKTKAKPGNKKGAAAEDPDCDPANGDVDVPESGSASAQSQVRKKRGRPSKKEIQAREAQAAAEAVGGDEEEHNGHTTVGAKKPAKRKAASSLPTKASKKAKVVEEVEVVRYVLPIRMDNGRFKCCVPSCDKDFLNVVGIRYHFGNHVHDVLDFLRWAYPVESTPAATEQPREGAVHNDASAAPGGDTEVGGPATVSADGPSADIDLTADPPSGGPATQDANQESSASEEKGVRADVIALYDEIPFDSWPISIDTYETYIPRAKKPTTLAFQMGVSKERIARLREKQKEVISLERKKRLPLKNLREKTTVSSPVASVKKLRGETATSSPVGSPKGKGIRQGDLWISYLPHPQMKDEEEESVVRSALPDITPAPIYLRDFELVSDDKGVEYLPAKGPVNIKINLGGTAGDPFTLAKFETVPCSNKRGSRKRVLCYAGGSVWGLDWCPLPEDASTQYLAVGGYKMTIEEHHVLSAKQDAKSGADAKGCIQIWNPGHLSDDKTTVSESDTASPMLDMCILHEYGCVFDIKWAPAGHYQDPNLDAGTGTLPQLGIFAVTFGDGSLRLLQIPHPSAMRRSLSIAPDQTLYVKANTYLLTASMPDATFSKLAWNGPDMLASTCSNGAIALWSLREAIERKRAAFEESAMYVDGSDGSPEDDPEPLAYILAHEANITALEFTGPYRGRIGQSLLTSGADGRLLTRDIRDPWSSALLTRFPMVMAAMTYVPMENRIVFADSENVLRTMRVGEEAKNPSKKENKDDGDDAGAYHRQRTSYIAAHQACIWHVKRSDHLPFVCSGSADGSVTVSTVRRTGANRFHKPVQVFLYRLEYDQPSDTFTLFDDLNPQIVADNPRTVPINFFGPEIAIQKVAWNPNVNASSWIASAGTAGLVRIETCFKFM
ncbi:WD40-repeat-containing domain protein [Fimicolochytrium jonesii]|uniref:WD40-repeat-containing domain protein n=1 Tax=Fimicolochytrium jonesii TaxID=1396493 RepID=UPI0022FEFA35|nr:WD40-repeat-containing domain protein [Fimicolochytrium jonesii]KAI8817950.1 WD40-repeat-containing domain protein [Fimicolochytrium jonesii]